MKRILFSMLLAVATLGLAAQENTKNEIIKIWTAINASFSFLIFHIFCTFLPPHQI